MSSVLDSISALAPEIVPSLAARLGEPADAVQKGLQTSVATMLGTILGRVNDGAFMSRVSNSIGAFGAANPLGSAATGANTQIAPAAMEAGLNLLNTLFSGNRSAIESRIAQTSGLETSSAQSILSSAAPLLLSVLGSKLLASGAGLAGLEALIESESVGYRNLIPSGLPGISHLSSLAASAVLETGREAPGALESKAAGKSWLLPVLLLGAVVIGALVWYYNRGVNNAQQAADAATKTATAVAGAGNSAIAALGEYFKRKLPNRVELNIPHFGIENKLIDFIEGSSKPADKEIWFDFDRLLFDTGSPTLQPSSEEQMQNIAAILKAYPNVNIRIGGYTDNTGRAAANAALAENRADNVLANLARFGVDPSRMDAKGYGAEHPIADNATEEGRAKNRRISLRVTQK